MIHEPIDRRRWLPAALSVLLVVSLLLAAPGGAAAASCSPAAAGRLAVSSGTTLAVVRAAGAVLYDEGGQPRRDLVAGAAVKICGRTADNLWFYGTLKDGTAGWVSSASVVIFGVKNVPERGGFAQPAPGAAAAAATAPETAPAVSAASSGAAAPSAVRLPAVVKTGAQRLNVRSGPGTTYPVVASIANAAALTAVGRATAADWIRVEIQQPTANILSGWVSALYLTLQGRASDLPIVVAAPPVQSLSLNPSAGSGQALEPSTDSAGLTGKLVFQESSGGKIDVYDLVSGALRTLTTGADPDVSPDGRTVVFWRVDGADHGLYLIDIAGGNERRILARTEKVRSPSWSPDGSKIVFSHVNGEHRCRDVGYSICLPDTYPYNFMFPLKTMEAWGLVRVDRTGGSYADVAAIVDATTPNWSTQGILYSGTGIQITQDVSDDNQNRVVVGEYRYRDPVGQPGGDRIVFHSLEKEHWEIFSAAGDGSDVTALTRPATTLVDVLPHNVAPAWSPDGRHIVFLSNRNGKWQLWTMDANGANQRALPIDITIEYNYQGEQVVSWGR